MRHFVRLFAIFLASGAVGGFCMLVESTVLRQRLPDLDSAGYYMATRFSEISGFLACTLSFTIFPYAAEKASKGGSLRPLIFKSLAANACFCALIALPFMLFGERLLSLLPHGDLYAGYWWAIPWLIGLGLISSVVAFYTTSEIAAGRLGYLKWYMPLDLAYPVLLLLVTGHAYFSGMFPSSWTEFLTDHNIYSLKTMLLWMTASNTVKVAGCLVALKVRQTK